LASVLITLSKGQVSPAPIQMQQGWYLIKLEDKKSSKPPSFEQAKPAIRAGMTQRKQFEFLSQLAKDAKIIVQQ
jgi:peptidyl-prolyl cis-trans isomerase C